MAASRISDALLGACREAKKDSVVRSLFSSASFPPAWASCSGRFLAWKVPSKCLRVEGLDGLEVRHLPSTKGEGRTGRGGKHSQLGPQTVGWC